MEDSRSQSTGYWPKEKGVILPILAVVIAGVLAVLIGLGLDASKVKKASTELSQWTESFCSYAAASGVIQKEALRRFSDQVNTSLARGFPRNSVLTKAHVFLPTMPSQGSFPPEAEPFLAGTHWFGSLSAHYPPGQGIQCNLSCAGIDGCENDCLYSGEVGGNFPSGIWNNADNAGNTMGCEITAVVRGILHRSTEISAKSMWWIPVRGPFDYSPGSPDTPGLAVIVAPHMTTDSADTRFRFEESLPVGFRSSFDPLYEFGGAGETLAFTGRPNGQRYKSTPDGVVAPLGPTETLSAADRTELLVSCMNPAIMVRNLLLGTIMEYASRHGQLRSGTEVLLAGTQPRYTSPNEAVSSLARANPVQMVPFGSDIGLENYQLPFVFYDSAYSRGVLPVPPPQVPPDSELYYWAPPAAPVQTQGFLPESFRHAQGGLLDPFIQSENPYWDLAPVESHPKDYDRAKVQRHHAFLVNQLRFCYHMYFGPAPQGKLRPDVLTSTNNFGFEPPADGREPYYFSSPYRTVDDVLRSPFSGVPGDPWDQQCPWGDHSCPRPRTRLLDASELMWALGSVQKCPFRQDGLPVSISQAGVCEKPLTVDVFNAGSHPTPTLDLRPDLLGSLQYLAGQVPRTPLYYQDSTGAQIPKGNIPMEAVASPGLFPLVYSTAFTEDQLKVLPPIPPLGNPWYPFGTTGGNYVAPADPIAGDRQKAPILLFTHQRMSFQEQQAIRTLICNSTDPTVCLDAPLNRRPITVVYMPTAEIENAGVVDWRVIEQVITDFKYAFNVSDSTPADSRLGNALFVLSPYLARYNEDNPNHGDQENIATPYTGSASERYRAYWHDLFDETREENVDQIARNIFYSRILMHDVKF